MPARNDSRSYWSEAAGCGEISSQKSPLTDVRSPTGRSCQRLAGQCERVEVRSGVQIACCRWNGEFLVDTGDRLRRYAEEQAVPWFIVSAEHGLVRRADWLAPHDTDLNAQTPQYRNAWGAWIVAKLDRLVGGVEGKTVEIHASPTYIEPIAAELSRLHATVIVPLADVDWDDHPGWYDEQLAL